MQHGVIRHIVSEHLKMLDRYSSLVAAEFDLEIIHKLRVEFKKLRAFLRLYAFAHQDDSVRTGKKLKELYAISGAIRDAQMHLVRSILERSEALTGYALWLTNFISRGQQEWKSSYDPKIVEKLSARMHQVEWQPVSAQQLLDFFREKIGAIDAVVRKNVQDDEDLHDIRKEVKDLQHVARLCEQKWPEGAAAISPLPLKALEHLATYAGDYNDERNALERLQQYIDSLDKPSRDLLQLRDQWTGSRDHNREVLIEGIAEFRSHASALMDVPQQ